MSETWILSVCGRGLLDDGLHRRNDFSFCDAVGRETFRWGWSVSPAASLLLRQAVGWEGLDTEIRAGEEGPGSWVRCTDLQTLGFPVPCLLTHSEASFLSGFPPKVLMMVCKRSQSCRHLPVVLKYVYIFHLLLPPFLFSLSSWTDSFIPLLSFNELLRESGGICMRQSHQVYLL